MDSDTQIINENAVENTVAPTDTKDENKAPENSENTEQKNVIDVIGNGQLVKKVCKNCRHV